MPVVSTAVENRFFDLSNQKFARQIVRCLNNDNTTTMFLISVENMNSALCKVEFVVEKADPLCLADALQIPAVFCCRQRSICNGLEGLFVLLSKQVSTRTGLPFLLQTHSWLIFLSEKARHVPGSTPSA